MSLSNVSLAELSQREWDAVVVGAGTAGASAALQLAARGQSTLLVEGKAFPRDKVCGGCLNQRAWMALAQLQRLAGQPTMPMQVLAAGAVPVDQMRLNCLGQEAKWSTPVMHAISRRTLDVVLVEASVGSGAVFCSETSARVINDEAAQFRSLRLTNTRGESCVVKAKSAIIADGLGHSSLSEFPEMASQVESGSRIGLGAMIDDPSDAYAAHELTMAVGRDGYVGLTRVEYGRLNVAAAVDAGAMKSRGPLAVVISILESCRLPIPVGIEKVKWMGTLPLTRTSREVAARRLFKIGDSASYVEPFTGEGMSWAIQDAVNLSELLTTADVDDCDLMMTTWNEQWKRKLKSKQWVCRGLAGLLRHPRAASVSLVAARWLPWIPQWLIARASGVERTRMKPGVIG